MFKVIFGIVGFIASIALMINGIYGFTCEHVLFNLFGLDSGATAVISYIVGLGLFVATVGKYIFIYLLNCLLKDE